jgi:predicted lipoprotein with Yx(FWY)xxD motif
MKATLVAIAVAAAALTMTGLVNASQRSDKQSAAPQVAPRTLIVRSTQYGRVLFDGRGRVLYGFTRDRRGGPSRCYGACAGAWPVYFARNTAVIRVGLGVKKSLIDRTRRRDGRLQLTYNGWPLYYYAHEGPGEVRCQNVDQFGGLWLVVRPSGTLVR